MNTETGEFRRLKADELPNPNEILVRRLPNPECRRCRGEGNLGRNGMTKKLVPCTCVTRPRGKQLTYQDQQFEEKRNLLKQMLEVDEELEKNKQVKNE